MQIQKINVNGFGKLNNVDISLKPGINVIKGNNESGKSTLVDFIKCTLYGISKNKNGNAYSDVEKYTPWGEQSFSGRTTLLVDGDEYTIFRDFAKNKATITDREGNDVSEDFSKDKSKGVDFGNSKLGIDEETFLNSICVKQSQVDVDTPNQNAIIQKLGNIIQTGDESISYDELQKKLDKYLADEIGTDRAFTKPKSMLKKEISRLEVRESELESNRSRNERINEATEALLLEKESIKKRLEDLNKVFEVKEKYDKELQSEKMKFDIEQKNKQKQAEEHAKQIKRNKIIDTVIILIAIIAVSISFWYFGLSYLIIGAIIVGIIAIFVDYKFMYKDEQDVDIESFEVVAEMIRKKQAKEIDALEKSGVDQRATELSFSELKTKMRDLDENMNQIDLEAHKYKIEQDSIQDGLNELNDVVEDLYSKNDELKVLLEKETTINTAIDVLRESYEEIKKRLIPSVEEDIKYTVSKTTNGKYQEIKYNDQKGLLALNEYGELITIDKLSGGTIDQIYLGFRMAIADKYNNLPLIFDETFVYFDETRLSSILKTISEISGDKQIIILSCSNREEQSLDKLNIDYNLIQL